MLAAGRPLLVVAVAPPAHAPHLSAPVRAVEAPIQSDRTSAKAISGDRCLLQCAPCHYQAWRALSITWSTKQRSAVARLPSPAHLLPSPCPPTTAQALEPRTMVLGLIGPLTHLTQQHIPSHSTAPTTAGCAPNCVRHHHPGAQPHFAGALHTSRSASACTPHYRHCPLPPSQAHRHRPHTPLRAVLPQAPVARALVLEPRPWAQTAAAVPWAAGPP